MSHEILSQAEVDSLLDDLEAATNPPGKTESETDKNESVQAPRRIDTDQLEALKLIHQAFGKRLAAALSTMLRSQVTVDLSNVIQCSYNGFLAKIESPTYLGILHAEPLEGPWILELSPVILYPIIDRLLGGGKVSRPQARRALTEIELRLTSRVTNAFLSELTHSWESIVDLDMSVEQVENNPHLTRTLPNDEHVFQISFDVSVNSVQDTVHLCIPVKSIEPLHDKLAILLDSYTQDSTKTKDEQRVELVVTLAEASITADEFDGLSVGDIIMTDTKASTLLGVAVDGTERFRASPGASKGKKAIEIKELL